MSRGQHFALNIRGDVAIEQVRSIQSGWKGRQELSKSSANPRRYSKGKEALDPNETLFVYIEIRVGREDIPGLDTRLKYLASRRPEAVLDVVGIRKEANTFITTLAMDMGPMRQALRGTSAQEQVGYDLIWDLFEQLPEFGPVFAAPPAMRDRANARQLGLTLRDARDSHEDYELQRARMETESDSRDSERYDFDTRDEDIA